jgi:acetyltransferase EpsM
MKKTVMLWGSMSKAKIVHKLILNQHTELNISSFNTNLKNNNKLSLKYIFDPQNLKITFKTEAIYSNKLKDLKLFIKKSSFFFTCIGSNHGKARFLISKELEKLKIKPLNLINRLSHIDKTSVIGVGLLTMPNAVVHSNAKIGDYCILNTSSVIEHECIIGNGVHVMSGACVAGRVKIGNYVTIGTNATILPDLKISDGAFIGAGAVVTKNVKKNEIVTGNPAKFVKYNFHQNDLSIFKKLVKIK